MPSLAEKSRQSLPPDRKTARTGQRRLVLNIAGQLTGFALSIGLGIWYTPYLIRHLGTESFGLVPLATTFATYLSLFTISLTNSLARFLTIAVERGDEEEAGRIFNTSFFGGLTVVLIMAVPAALVTVYWDGLAKAPTGLQGSVSGLFFCAITGFLLTVVVAPFNIATWVRNRLDLRTAGDALYNITRVLVVVVLFAIFAPSLWHVGVGLLAASILLALYSVITSKRLVPYLRINRSQADWRVFKELYKTSSWMMVDQLGNILCGGLDLWLANRMLGAAMSGQYAIALQWSGLMRNLGSTMTSVLAPSTVLHFANDDRQRMMEHAFQGTRLAGLVVALPVGILCGLAKPVLGLWVGPSFEVLAPLMRMVLLPVCVLVCGLPLYYVLVALNAVRAPALWTIVLGALNVGLIVVLAKPFLLYGVAAASVLTVVLKNGVFLPWYTGRVTRQRRWPYFGQMLRSLVLAVGTAVCTHFAGIVIGTRSWFHLAACAAAVSCAFVAGSYLFALNQNERNVIAGLWRRLAPAPEPES